MQTQIKINSSRALQLRVLAAKTGTSISTLIERLINDLVTAGEIPDQFQDLAISRQGANVAIVLAGQALPFVSIKTGRHLAQAFGQMLAGTAGGAVRVAISGSEHVECRRVGVGYRVAWVATDTQVNLAALTITKTMLSDVIRQLGSAAR